MEKVHLLRRKAVAALHRSTEKIMEKCGTEHIYAGRYETALLILLLASLRRRKK